ncbi:hypothetical protein CICLE_v10030548mg [Citrus x clementina]|uniref:Uncharacterized protein n=1 Tax=Citrus clementina TaxID=85681 RepID=V4TI96_CITCL|nr:mucin-12 [Citrus x clementina]ESR51345.1 hypothetical protein CICLE_v10030548mg [Citrus x clementina]
MPPSPALKCSPGRELRGENHKRGRSFESGILFREKDDDLALFNEMQTKEKETFLLQSSDDFEDTFSTKLRHFSDIKLGISIPVRGEGSELLNADGEKNDYDWLLTPPDTPLFRSLDDEPAPVNVARKGRPRSQPISISRSSTMEKSYRSSRGSPSPNRLSPSPRSGNSSFQSTRGRPSSAPQSSPTPALRSATPTRRPSPPPSKSSTSAPRSSTPTPRRMSTGSRGTAVSPSVRGTSPIRTSRGNSASPKIRGWQSNIPGFTLEAPPNLRTSLSDRPASYVRGSSPASRNGKDSTSKFSRQSMSPTASRSISSSHSHDRDRFSSHSKGSFASSGDDDMDSLQSIPIGGSDYSVSKRVGAYPNNRAPAFSKKSPRILSSSSAPKRSSFDSALRQMDNRRSPQNMFRPLLSSVPSSTFFAGKSSSNHRSMISRNSSVTTSSNASSDQGISVAHDTEGNEHHQDDVTSGCGKVLYCDVQEEVFSFDKVDSLDEEDKHERHEKSPNHQLSGLETDPSTKCNSDAFEEFNHHGTDIDVDPTSKALTLRADSSEVCSSGTTRLCSRCNLQYRVIETVERDINLCPDCRKQNDLATVTNPKRAVIAAENSSVSSMKISEDNKPFDELNPPMIVSELQSQVSDTVEPRVSEVEKNVAKSQTPNSEQSQIYSRENSTAGSPLEGGEEKCNYLQDMGQPDVGYDLADRDTEGQRLQLSNDHLDMKVFTSEGAGISLLLKRSTSIKGPVVQGRTFTATNIPYEDLSYARDSSNSLRSSVGHGSVSASSSIDFSSSRQSDTRVQRQLSGRKLDMENYRYDLNTKPQSIGSSLPGSSVYTHQVFGLARSTHENSEASVGDVKHGVERMPVTSQSEVLASENKEAGINSIAFTDVAVLEEGILGRNESSRTMDASTSEFSSHMAGMQSEQNSVASFPNYEDRTSCENGEEIPKIARSASDVEASVIIPESSYEEEHSMLDNGPDGMDDAKVPSHSALATISEIEVENSCQNPLSSQMAEVSPRSTSITNEFQEPSVPTSSDKDITAVPNLNISDHAHGILEESTVLVESRGGSKARSLTLEEATDAILFCSSIVHDIAYQAATIAMERESSVPLEDSRPTVTILGKSNLDRRNLRGRAVGKQTSKAHKARQRRVETNEKPPLIETENDENADESLIQNVGLPNKGDNLKPPKLESKCNCTIM